MFRWARSLVFASAPLLLVLAAEGQAAEVAEGVVRFALCRTNIQSSSLFKAGEQWGFLVSIDRKAQKELGVAARLHPEHTLEVTMGDVLLHRGPIAVAAASGSFTGLGPDRLSAQRDLDLFRNNLYEGPCGVIEGDGP